MKGIGSALVIMAAALAACSGGGGGEPGTEVQSGKVDMSYGTAGKATSGLSMLAAAVDVAGNAYVTGAAVAKYGRSGMQVAGYGAQASSPERAPLPDGAGNLFTLTEDGAVVKRDASGQLAASFGNGGRAQVTPWGVGFNSVLSGLHRDAAGNLVVIGLVQGPHYSFNNVAIAKVDPAGQPVASFGTGGRKFTGVDLGPFFWRVASTPDAQGNIIVAGLDDFSRLVVAKLDPQGDRVAGFGQGGQWVAPSCGAGGNFALAAGTDGSIYAGVSCEGLPTLFKLDGQGALVGTFGSAGRAVGFFTTGGHVGALLAAADGSLYVSGATLAAGGLELAVAKLSADGVPLAGFGTGGVALTGAAPGDGMMLARDGSGLLYAGSTSPTDDAVPLAPSPYVIFRLGP